MLLSSRLLAASALLLFSLPSLTQAIPQGNQNGGGGGGGQQGGQGQSTEQTTATVATASKATSTATTTSEAADSTSTVACNNSPLLCSRDYNNITHMGAHDAAFLRDSSDDYSVSGNQYYNATIALSAGIRLIQAQVHNSSGTLELCHTSCDLLDAGPLETLLADIKTWMDDNTNEVVTLLLVNSDDEEAAAFGEVFDSSGISTYGYTPTSTTGPISTWPTLQTLIDADTRLVTFIASITYDDTYPYLLTEFDYVFETTFGVTSLSEFNCTLQRPTTISSAADAVSSGYMGLINHFADTAEALDITIPDVTDIYTTNSPDTNVTGALGLNAEQCDSEWGEKPTFILVDFWNVGPAIDTADKLNGIVATGRTSVSTEELTAGTSSGGGLKMRMSVTGVAGLSLAVVAFGNIVWL